METVIKEILKHIEDMGLYPASHNVHNSIASTFVTFLVERENYGDERMVAQINNATKEWKLYAEI